MRKCHIPQTGVYLKTIRALSSRVQYSPPAGPVGVVKNLEIAVTVRVFFCPWSGILHEDFVVSGLFPSAVRLRVPVGRALSTKCEARVTCFLESVVYLVISCSCLP